MAVLRGDEAVGVEVPVARKREARRAGDGHVALPGAERRGGGRERDETARARRVHRKRGPAKVELVRDACRDVVLFAAGLGQKPAPGIEGVVQPASVEVVNEVAVDAARREDASSRGRAAARRVACRLHGVPRRLEKHALLRIHQLRLRGGYAPEEGVKFVGVRDELRRADPARVCVPTRRGQGERRREGEETEGDDERGICQLSASVAPTDEGRRRQARDSPAVDKPSRSSETCGANKRGAVLRRDVDKS